MHGLLCCPTLQSNQQQLRQSEEHFPLLVEGVRDYAIFMLGPDGRIVSWNEGAGRIQGYEVWEVVGEHFSVFYADEDVERGLPGRSCASRLSRADSSKRVCGLARTARSSRSTSLSRP
jgi:PAS domain-containing protein